MAFEGPMIIKYLNSKLATNPADPVLLSKLRQACQRNFHQLRSRVIFSHLRKCINIHPG